MFETRRSMKRQIAELQRTVKELDMHLAAERQAVKDYEEFSAKDEKAIAEMSRELEAYREKNRKLALAKENAATEIDRLNAEINQLIEANGALKRELDTESKQKDELDKLLCQAQRRYTCPEDCAHQANYRGCRTCTRNPHAVDKYEAADHFAACGY